MIALSCGFPPSMRPADVRTAGRVARVRAGVGVRLARALRRRLGRAGAGGGGHRPDRRGHRGGGAEPAPSRGHRVGDRDHRGARARPSRGRVRHRLHRAPGHGEAGHAVGRPRALRHPGARAAPGRRRGGRAARACQLLYSPGFGPRPPIDVPLLVAPAGPKGFAVAHDVADGVVLVGLPPEGESDPRWSTSRCSTNGTVLDPGEDHTSERVRAGRRSVVRHQLPRDVRVGTGRAGVDAGWRRVARRRRARSARGRAPPRRPRGARGHGHRARHAAARRSRRRRCSEPDGPATAPRSAPGSSRPRRAAPPR